MNEFVNRRSKHFRMHPRHDMILNRYFGSSEAAQAREDLDVLDALIKTGSVEVADLEMNPDEASLIVDACQDVQFDVSYLGDPLTHLRCTVENYFKLTSVAIKRDELLVTLKGLSPLGGLALIHMIRSFNAHNSYGRNLSIAEVFPLGR